MKETELKPCAKCGRKPKLFYSSDFALKLHTTFFKYICWCGNSSGAFEGTVEALKDWNRRADNEQREKT
jgi:hypothetical protein